MQNNRDLIELPEMAKNAHGGTELMLEKLFDGKVPRDLLEQFQIIPTRVRELKNDKYRVLWIHDTPFDPECQHLANDGWRKFHKLVFVSNWQMQQFIERFQIPWSKCVTVLNAIEPLEVQKKSKKPVKPDSQIKLVYHTTPHRGLNILLPVFDKLCQEHKNITLDLYSSYKLYGWQERDEQFKELFEFADKHEKITNHGTVSQDDIRKDLVTCDIFAYPSIWPETSCLCLMEAMSAGLLCVHPNYGALYETAANWTYMYNYHESQNDHARIFYHALDSVITNFHSDEALKLKTQIQKNYADSVYNWNSRSKMWEALLRSVIASEEPKEIPNEEFVYKF